MHELLGAEKPIRPLQRMPKDWTIEESGLDPGKGKKVFSHLETGSVAYLTYYAMAPDVISL
jgi:hypothetical protein